MTRTLLMRLAWKEYRAIRAFWLSLLALVALAVAAVAMFSIPSGWTTNLVYMIALGAPAFFALGCAGTAFALEREEGTYEQLRAWPVEAWQLLVSKLGVAFVATAAMFAAAWPIALLATRREVPQAEMLHDMLALWLTAAIEAIAWGTFFSLLNARPLMAVLMGLFVSTSIAHLLSWMVSADAHSFFVKHYVQAVPFRLLVAGAALAIDIYLGLRWLDLGDTVRSRSQFRLPPLFRRKARVQSVDSLVRRPERLAAIGRLFWQTWRQSRWAMCTIVLGQVSLTGLFLATFTAPDYASILLLMPFWAAIAGSFVFHSDQERKHYRFFIEHNVSPRWMWLMRQLPWFIVQTCAVAVQVALVLAVLFIRRERLGDDLAVTNLNARIFSGSVFPILFAWIIGFAAGQWTSMFVKSGLLAGSFGIALTIILGGWMLLSGAMHISPLWTVAPLVTALMVGTWFRSPDWIADNTSWRARIQAATVVLVPTLAILVGVAAYRAYQIPLVNPGFDPDAYLAEITPESRETAEMYRRANDLFLHESAREEDLEAMTKLDDKQYVEHVKQTKTARRAKFIEENEACLAVLLEASKRPSCTLYDPRKPNERVKLFNSHYLIRLICDSGDVLGKNGKLDEAFDHYLCALRTIALWCDHLPTLGDPGAGLFQIPFVFGRIATWGQMDGQTPERLRAAASRLRDYGVGHIHFTDQIKSNYLVARFALLGNVGDRDELATESDAVAHRLSLLDWMPWEKTRELRAQNALARDALQRMAGLQKQLENYPAFDYRIQQSRLMRTPYSLFREISAFIPALQAGLGNESRDVDTGRALLSFKEHDVALRLQLAVQGFISAHSHLPETLNQLVPEYFDRLPFDPYTGRNFVYFPHGVFPPGLSDRMNWATHLRQLGCIPGQPGFWSPGEHVVVSPWVNLDGDNDVIRQMGNSYDVVYKAGEHPDEPVSESFYYVLIRGHWYPITVRADDQGREAKAAEDPAAAPASPEVAVP